MELLFENPWWTTLWLLIIFGGISTISKRGD